jgi:hypothetical protein
MINFKEGINPLDFFKIKPYLRLIIIDLENLVVEKYAEEITITNILGKFGVSDTHPEGRAVDLRTSNFSPLEREELAKYLNGKYIFNAISLSGNPFKVCIYGDAAHLDHFHIQIPREGV